MSSHHFVRAEQASCLYVHSNKISHELFMQLLEWNPIVVAHEDTVAWLNSLQVHIDIVLKLSDSTFELPYPHKTWQWLAEEKMLIDKIIDHIVAARLLIIGVQDDSTIRKILDHAKHNEVVVYEENRKHFVVKEDVKHKKWVDKGYSCSIFPEKKAIVEGKFKKNGSEYVILQEGIFVFYGSSRLIITEYL